MIHRGILAETLKNNARISRCDKNALSLNNLVIWKEGVMWEYLILKTET